MSEPRTTTSTVTGPVLDEVQSGVFDPTAPAVEKHYLLRITDAAAARAFVRGLRRLVTSEQDAHDAPDPESLVRVNVGFTAAGLAALGVAAPVLSSFPDEFLEGMAARKDVLGDVGESAPEKWEPAYHPAEDLHIWLMVQGPDDAAIAPTLTTVDAAAGTARLVLLATEHGAQFGPKLAPAKEHFGFNDNLSQPGVEGVGQPVYPGQGTPEWPPAAKGTDGCHGAVPPTWTSIPAGCFVLGHENNYGETPLVPADVELRTNSTFMVLRKLEQDVASFRTTVAGWAAQLDLDEELMAAKLVGRWRSGVPLELSPHTDDPSILQDPETANAFLYGAPGCSGIDADGVRVPRLAHIRRANPRDSLGDDSVVEPRNHRIIRRSAPYGTWLPKGHDDDGTPRGLLFRAFNASILDQFELVQSQWINSANEASGLSSDRDPFVGSVDTCPVVAPRAKPPISESRRLDPTFTVPMEDGRCPTLYGLPRFVTVKGGAYLFVPSITALARLGAEPEAVPVTRNPLKGVPFTMAYPKVAASPLPPAELREKLTEVVMYYQQALVDLGADLRKLDSTAVYPTVAGVLLGTMADAREVLTRNDVFTVAAGYGARLNDVTGAFMLGMDDTPQYQAEHSLMQTVAPSKDLPGIATWLDRYAEALVSSLATRTDHDENPVPFDAVTDVAVRTSLAWVGTYFGVPGPNDATMITWLRAIGIYVFEFWAPLVPGAKDATAQMAVELQHYLDQLIEVRVAQIRAGDPSVPDDVLNRLVALALDADPLIDLVGIRRNLAGFALGSSVALSTNIAFAVAYLLDPLHVDQRKTLEAAIASGDRALIRGCMLEAVRLAAPSPPSIFRIATEDTTIAAGTKRETPIPRGSLVIVNPAIAMTDPIAVKDPATFDPERPMSTYLMFGAGQHECFGTAIATMMLESVGAALFSRPGLTPTVVPPTVVPPTLLTPTAGSGYPGQFYPASLPVVYRPGDSGSVAQ